MLSFFFFYILTTLTTVETVETRALRIRLRLCFIVLKVAWYAVIILALALRFFFSLPRRHCRWTELSNNRTHVCFFFLRAGYGNVTPRTLTGKLATILYAIVGMPLFLLYLSNIGDILAKSFKWIYAKCCLCRGCKKRRKRMLAIQRKEQWKVRPVVRTNRSVWKK